ncbi:alpha/beta hydrolase fold domain-containing protein [Aquabacterium sp. OR-4]|uniref:alpha/beta hydrolase fold domain-containing protein n=1 Tax=Aquabacterium sp. OR-4 TaxID=2978127 RepID=UPI0028C7CDA0|nr:alpha/beta hydrolase fold domain-containing protein [Aquabacterium sp. OR-4]MDT7838862.1 alpha/beta hydrolase fold domain-containing protein [Aquabacterium sp. OR-4]
MVQRNSQGASARPAEVDVVVVGAGFAGLYLLHKLRGLGFSTRVFEAASDVGGTWYWNRYPGARCDIPTTDYSFGFDPALEQAWTWSEKYATQPEILRYAQFVANFYDLRRDIDFDTRVEAALWDEGAGPADGRWHLRTSRDEPVRCRFYIMATGCLSQPKAPEIAGAERFQGASHSTSRWPHGGVDFTGQRVAVIGTGSSGIQSIPLIAQQASQLTVFQRTPNFSIPAGNGPVREERLAPLRADRAAYRQAARWSRAGVPLEPPQVYGRYSPPELRSQRFEAAWNTGELIPILSVFADQILFPDANEVVCEKVREKIRAVVTNPETAERLSPRDHAFGTKRPCLDTGYYATFNQPHVRLVDLRQTPIERITETGIALRSGEALAFDAIVYATGFDAMTGALVAVDITGRNGLTLKDKWAHGPSTYLGLMTTGFPNFFTITGPGSPSVLSNMMVSIEQHVEWVSDCLAALRAQGHTRIEPTEAAEAGWVQHVNDCAGITLYPSANSWYMGANVPGKPRVFLPYVGGVDTYRRACDEVVARNYLGLRRSGPAGELCADGLVRRLQPDVQMVLEMMAAMQLPTFDSLPVEAARGMLAQLSAASPPGPAVAEEVDGTLPGAAGPLAYRLYRPATPGPHPVVVYFHGGGWVLGDQASDDPLCRDLCRRSGAMLVSVNYRHAPEARFPAAADDALAAVRWLGEHAAALGGRPGPLAVAGWSAGGNLAAVTCQRVRDEGGPAIAGQLLLTPVTDTDLTRPSYQDNAEGYVLTRTLMHWFFDHYVDAADRADARVAPLRARSLAGLPPAMIVTAQFDPLRDEGLAYAQALAAAGVPVRSLSARGHTHTSLGMVDVVVSGEPVRAEMAAALRGFWA